MSDKVDKHEMAEAELEAEPRGQQAGEERRGSNASQVVDCCLDTMAEQLCTMGFEKAEYQFVFMREKILKTRTLPAQMPGEEGIMKKKTENKGQHANKWVHLRQVVALKAFSGSCF